MSYLGRYLHRTATANARLIEIEQGQVIFEYSDNRDRDETKQGKLKPMSLSAVKFIRRFLRHILPRLILKALSQQTKL